MSNNIPRPSSSDALIKDNATLHFLFTTRNKDMLLESLGENTKQSLQISYSILLQLVKGELTGNAKSEAINDLKVRFLHLSKQFPRHNLYIDSAEDQSVIDRYKEDGIIDDGGYVDIAHLATNIEELLNQYESEGDEKNFNKNLSAYKPEHYDILLTDMRTLSIVSGGKALDAQLSNGDEFASIVWRDYSIQDMFQLTHEGYNKNDLSQLISSSNKNGYSDTLRKDKVIVRTSKSGETGYIKFSADASKPGIVSATDDSTLKFFDMTNTEATQQVYL